MTLVGMKLAKRIAEGQSRLASAEFSSRINDRYFEDYVQGAVYQFGEITVSPEEIMNFAKRYDPQDYHTNVETAAKTRVGGLIASGWHTSAMMMRMFCDNFLTKNASLPSPGVDELRWVAPVRPGDIISLRVTIVEARRSASKPDRGMVRSKIEVLNQKGEVVMTLVAMNLIACRNLTSSK